MDLRRAVQKVAAFAVLAVLGAALTTPNASAQEPTPGLNSKTPKSVMTPDKVETRIGTPEFFNGIPTKEMVAPFYDNRQQKGDSTPREWDFYAAAYGWLAGVDGTVAVSPLTEIPVDVPFGDVIDNVDIGFSLHLEVQQARGWTFLGDVFFVDLGFSASEPVSETPLTVDQKQTIVEGAVGYHVARDWEILGVVRYNDLSVSASAATGESDERSASWIDAFGGVRFTSALSNRWMISARADAGAGGSSFAWFVNASVFYGLSDLIWLTTGYRALSVDYEDGSGRDLVKWDMVTHGLFLGIVLTP